MNRSPNDIIRSNEWLAFISAFYAIRTTKKVSLYYSKYFLKTFNSFIISIFMKHLLVIMLSALKFEQNNKNGDNKKIRTVPQF